MHACPVVLIGRATREDVEDLVQEVFLTAWRQLATLRDPAAFGGWVVTIARHLRIDHGRRQRAGAQDVRNTATQEAGAPVEAARSNDAPADDRSRRSAHSGASRFAGPREP